MHFAIFLINSLFLHYLSYILLLIASNFTPYHSTPHHITPPHHTTAHHTTAHTTTNSTAHTRQAGRVQDLGVGTTAQHSTHHTGGAAQDLGGRGGGALGPAIIYIYIYIQSNGAAAPNPPPLFLLWLWFTRDGRTMEWALLPHARACARQAAYTG